MRETTIYSNGDDGPRVLIRERGGKASIVIQAGDRYLSLSPSWAAQAATGVDAALDRISRNGTVRRTP